LLRFCWLAGLVIGLEAPLFGVSNVSNYCTPELEKLVTQYMEESDRAKRMAIWKKVAGTFLVDDVAYYVIGWPNIRNYVWRDEVKNWERGPGQDQHGTLRSDARLGSIGSFRDCGYAKEGR